MDLDYQSIRALASPTRLKILNMVLEEEATTTKISDEIDLSKSTVSSHLKTLTDSGLLEKDDKEGRRRVIYRPTDKARAIVEGRERKVKFSIVSSALTAAGGFFLIQKGLRDAATYSARTLSEESINQGSAGGMGAMDVGEAAAAQTANQTAAEPGLITSMIQSVPEKTVFLVLGALLLLLTLALGGYTYLHREIGKKEE